MRISGEITSFGVSPENYSDSELLSASAQSDFELFGNIFGKFELHMPDSSVDEANYYLYTNFLKLHFSKAHFLAHLSRRLTR